MTTATRLNEVTKSMTRQQILHDAALKIIAIEQEAKDAYKAAGGNWEEDAAADQLANLLEEE